MKLIIAEKPSVARDIAAVVGATKRCNGYLEGGGYLVSWCVGHLINLAQPAEYDEKYKQRRIEDLPIFPDTWKFTINEATASQFETLKKLMDRDDVDSLICATDAGREGEHIFRLVYQEADCKKPFKRLWISSMEASAIKEGMDNLKDGHTYDNLADAAMCRAKADWLVGMNISRLFTTPVGRVQTPTLALVVRREEAIANFKPTFSYVPKIEKDGFVASGEKFELESEAQAVAVAADGQAATVTKVEKKSVKSNPPKLYDLTTLQREASRFFGLTAKETLETAQTLYEAKLITYPRTDSSFITEDMGDTAAGLLDTLKGHQAFPFLAALTDKPDIKRVTDNSKVSDHHALLPTKSVATHDISSLPDNQQKVLSMLVARIFVATAPPETAEAVLVELSCGGHIFKAKGRTVLSEGYTALQKAYKAYLKVKETNESNESEEETEIPALTEDIVLEDVAAHVDAVKSSPPAHFTEDTLLAAMERAGNEDYEDDETEKKGLGTPATMADMIDGLVNRSKFLERKGKQILPTVRGKNLIRLLPETLTSPKMTAAWETELQRMAKGAVKADVFMKGIQDFVNLHIAQFDELTEEQKALIPEPLSKVSKESLGDCPRCSQPVYEGKKNYYCSNKECGFFLMLQPIFFQKAKKKLTKAMMKSLLDKGHVKVTGLYSEKKDKTYDATVVLDDPGEGFVNFKLEFTEKMKKDTAKK